MVHNNLFFGFPGETEIVQGRKINIRSLILQGAPNQEILRLTAGNAAYHSLSVLSNGTLQIKNDTALATGGTAQTITLTQDAVLGGLSNLISTTVSTDTLSANNLVLVTLGTNRFRQYSNSLNMAFGSFGVGSSDPLVGFSVYCGTGPTGGNATVSAGGTTVTGVGAGGNFLNAFKVGDTITMNSETHTVSAIASATSMTTDAWTNAATAASYTIVGGTRFSVLNNGLIGIGTSSPTAFLDIPASITGYASLRIRTGVTPTTLNDGDMWQDGTNVKIRIGGVTKTFTLT